MKRYELNGLGDEWVFEANSEEEATKNFIWDICRAKTIEQYNEYCREVNVNSEIKWEEKEIK